MTENLNTEFATPQAYVDHLNGQTPGSNFELVYGEHMGSTAQDVADYLDMATFSNCYKDQYGFRPRGYTLEQAREWLVDDANEQIEDVARDMARNEPVVDGDGWSFNGDPASIERDLEDYYGGALTDLPELDDDSHDDICDIREAFGYFGAEL